MDEPEIVVPLPTDHSFRFTIAEDPWPEERTVGEVELLEVGQPPTPTRGCDCNTRR